MSDQRKVDAKGVEWRVLRKATKKRKLNGADKSFNKKSNKTRAKVTPAFGVMGIWVSQELIPWLV